MYNQNLPTLLSQEVGTLKFLTRLELEYLTCGWLATLIQGQSIGCHMGQTLNNLLFQPTVERELESHSSIRIHMQIKPIQNTNFFRIFIKTKKTSSNSMPFILKELISHQIFLIQFLGLPRQKPKNYSRSSIFDIFRQTTSFGFKKSLVEEVAPTTQNPLNFSHHHYQLQMTCLSIFFITNRSLINLQHYHNTVGGCRINNPFNIIIGNMLTFFSST